MATGKVNWLCKTRPRPDEVMAHWQTVCKRYSADDAIINNCFDELMKHYSEPQRFYHNRDHISFLLRHYEAYEKELIKKDVVLFSIFYHDVIYIPGWSDNETKSAAKAGERLRELNVPDDKVEDTVLYIEATRHHHAATPKEADLRYFLDFDLSILADDPETYATYADAVRKEYSFLPDEQYNPGRKAFVQSMLNLPHLFFTPHFRQREDAARRNLNWELNKNLRHI